MRLNRLRPGSHGGKVLQISCNLTDNVCRVIKQLLRIVLEKDFTSSRKKSEMEHLKPDVNLEKEEDHHLFLIL